MVVGARISCLHVKDDGIHGGSRLVGTAITEGKAKSEYKKLSDVYPKSWKDIKNLQQSEVGTRNLVLEPGNRAPKSGKFIPVGKK